MKAPDRYYDFEKDISGCGVFGVISKNRRLIPGDIPIRSMACMHDRGNGQGAGYAAYGIYPDMADKYAFHLMGKDQDSFEAVEKILKKYFTIHLSEPIPTRKVATISHPPVLKRYFLSIREDRPEEVRDLSEEDYVVKIVMDINANSGGGKRAFVFSSGKNMGAFKGVGFPEEIADFYRLEDYKAYIWTGHNRFPTNTPGWWGGAHPFTLLDWSIVHNGEISSYGINRRYLCERDYLCTLMTDTEVVAYLLDMLIRKHGLPIELACKVFAPPFWDEIAKMPQREKELYTALRMTYGSAMLNGPFAILVANGKGLLGLNDRIKLRPLVVAEKDDLVFMASEESAIREVQPELDRVWMPKAGEPVIVHLEA